jgi:N-acetylglucosamine-6-phosphate deacetylase
VGAALMSDVYCELIADKIHINKDIFQFVLNNKGKDKVILVTDSMRAGCMEDGEYELGGQVVYVKENSARLKNGTLAGSVLTLNKAVYNFLGNTNLKLHEAIGLASLNPAKSINIENRKGSLDIGKDADISLFDKDMNCYLTIVEGRKVFNKII